MDFQDGMARWPRKPQQANLVHGFDCTWYRRRGFNSIV